MENTEFAKFLKSMGKPCKFKPVVVYNEEGDLLQAVVKDCSYYAEWLGPNLSIFKDHKTNEIVGFSIEGVGDLMKSKKKYSYGKFPRK